MPVEPTDVLYIPNRRRLTHAMLANSEGKQELHIFYGEKEIIIDEQDLFPFGNKLLSVERFRADEAVSWSGAAPYDWERIRGLLEALIDESILKLFAEAPPPAPGTKTFPATLGRAPAGRQPETWSSHDDRCPVTSQRVLGHAMDLSNLEVLLPVQRVAHPALDRDGRQVGENNVNDGLFLDLPTERRVCNYAGSRYQSDLPMNSTALKIQVKRWPELLSLTEQFRTAFFARLPPQGPGLLAGEVHLLSVGALASVGYVMVRGTEPVPNGQLDAGLAGMFRIIDGIRIVTTEIVRDTAGTHGCDRPLDGKAIHQYAERYSLFRDTYGVCAGPAALIDEYLQVLVGEDSAPIKVEPNLASRIGDMEAALDYGLHGVRVESMVRAFAALQAQLHERLRQAFAQQASARTKLQDILELPVTNERYPFLRVTHPLREQLEVELMVCRWLFARARAGLPAQPGLPESLDELRRLDPASLAASQKRLAEFLAGASTDFVSLPEPLQGELAAVAAELFALERSFLRAVGREQQLINERLRRPRGRALNGEDFGAQARRSSPVLERVLAEGLDLTIAVEAESAVLSHGQQSLTLAD